jgi:FG-GAP repeat
VTPPQDTAAFPSWAPAVLPGGLGDVDGDGYADLAVFVEERQSGQGMGLAYLYRGGPSGISSAAPLAVPAPGGAPSFMGGAIGVLRGVTGDVDGDGFFDVLIASFSGSALLYRGASTGVESTPIAITGGTAGGGFGQVVARSPSPGLPPSQP